jgi:hypothetical protein
MLRCADDAESTDLEPTLPALLTHNDALEEHVWESLLLPRVHAWDLVQTIRKPNP